MKSIGDVIKVGARPFLELLAGMQTSYFKCQPQQKLQSCSLVKMNLVKSYYAILRPEYIFLRKSRDQVDEIIYQQFLSKSIRNVSSNFKICQKICN